MSSEWVLVVTQGGSGTQAILILSYNWDLWMPEPSISNRPSHMLRELSAGEAGRTEQDWELDSEHRRESLAGTLSRDDLRQAHLRVVRGKLYRLRYFNLELFGSWSGQCSALKTAIVYRNLLQIWLKLKANECDYADTINMTEKKKKLKRQQNPHKLAFSWKAVVCHLKPWERFEWCSDSFIC